VRWKVTAAYRADRQQVYETEVDAFSADGAEAAAQAECAEDNGWGLAEMDKPPLVDVHARIAIGYFGDDDEDYVIDVSRRGRNRLRA
jgi:hypothetical protein